MKKKMQVSPVILSIISVLIALLFITPIDWALAVSLKTEGTPIKNAFAWFLPPYTLENYPRILFGTYVPVWLFNSVFIAVLATACTLALTSMAAYAVAKIDFKGKNLLYVFFLLGMMVPGEATIVPLFITANDLNIIDSYAGLLFPTIAASMNFAIMTSFFRSVPNELIEAATIDGAGNTRVFVQILLPLSKTIMMTVGIFAFIGSWNNYLWPLLCAMDQDLFTLPIGIPTFVSMYTVDYVMPLTSNMVASIPAIVVFLIFEKNIVQGIALSGIKG